MSYTRTEGLWEDMQKAASSASTAVKKVTSVSNQIIDYAGKAQPVLDTAKLILDDPALPQIVGLVRELHDLEQGQTKVLMKRTTVKGLALDGYSLGDVPGIGLARVVKPLKFYVETRRKPWLLPAIVIGALAVPFALGYFVGRK